MNEKVFKITLNVLIQKWYISIKLIIEDEYIIGTITLFDRGAYLTCIEDGLIPIKYFEKTKDKLRFTNGSRL